VAKDPRLLSWWVYLIGPASGGVLAGVFQLLNGVMRENIDDKEEEKKEL